jgi:hypothetical protein
MGVADWLRVFRALHEKARAGGLSREDADAYRGGCDELARALMAAQRQAAKPGEAPRHALRVARAVQVDLETTVSHVRVITVELGVGGFSATLGKAPAAGEELKCRLRVPGGDPVETTVAPTEVKPHAGSVRVSFAFGKLDEDARQRLELLVIDTALSQLAS